MVLNFLTLKPLFRAALRYFVHRVSRDPSDFYARPPQPDVTLIYSKIILRFSIRQLFSGESHIASFLFGDFFLFLLNSYAQNQLNNQIPSLIARTQSQWELNIYCQILSHLSHASSFGNIIAETPVFMFCSVR